MYSWPRAGIRVGRGPQHPPKTKSQTSFQVQTRFVFCLYTIGTSFFFLFKCYGLLSVFHGLWVSGGSTRPLNMLPVCV